MPAQSQQQQKLFGLALSVKRGETPRSEASEEVLNIVDSMSEKQIKDFAETSHSGLPSKVEQQMREALRELMREMAIQEAELPNATIPANIKTKLVQAIDKIKDTNLNYNQKLQVIGKVVDSLGIDKKELGKISSKLKTTLESLNEADPCWKGYQQIGMKTKNGKEVPNCVPESVNESASRTAMEIGGLTGLNKDAIQKFVDTHNMDIEKVYQYVKKSKLTDRLNFVTAVVGTPGNSVQKKMIKMFGESINEGKFKVDDLVYNKRTKTVGIVRMGDDKYGEVKTDADGNVSVDELEKYNPIKFKHQTKAKVAPSTEKEVNSRGLFNPFKAESVNEEKLSDTWRKNNKKGYVLKVGNIELKSAGPSNSHDILIGRQPWGTFAMDYEAGGTDWWVKPMRGSDFWVKSIDDLVKKVKADSRFNESVNELKKLPSGNFSIKVGYPTFADYEKKAKTGDTILRYDKRGGMIKAFVNGSELDKNAEKYLDKVNGIIGGVVFLTKKGMKGVAQVPDYEKKDIGVLVLESKSVNEGSHGMATKLLQSLVKGETSKAEGIKMSKELAQHYIDWIRTSPFGKKNGNLPLDMLVKASFNWGIERGLDSKLKGELSKLKSTIKESINEADVVGKTVFSDGKGKLHFGYYKTDDSVEFVDYKTWAKLNMKDVSKSDMNKKQVLSTILNSQKQFNKKVEYNMWYKKTNPSFEQSMDYFMKNGFIGNITKAGIKVN